MVDSLRFAIVAARCEQEFGVALPDAAMLDGAFDTVADVVAYLCAHGIRLCAVEQVFTICGRGVAVSLCDWGNGRIIEGDTVEVRSARGISTRARAVSVEMVRFATPGPHHVDAHSGGALLLAGVHPEDIKPGDTLWTATPAE